MTAQRIVQAANGGVPAGQYRPNNCHEAALAWALQFDLNQCQPAHGAMVETAGVTVRTIAKDHCGHAQTAQLTGSFMGGIYVGKTLLTRGTLNTLQLGDVVAFGASQSPSHSTVVVRKAGADVYVRGFNNAGCFMVPAYHGTPPARYMAYDQTLRNLNRDAAWSGNKWKTHTGNLDVWRVDHATVCTNILKLR